MSNLILEFQIRSICFLRYLSSASIICIIIALDKDHTEVTLYWITKQTNSNLNHSLISHGSEKHWIVLLATCRIDWEQFLLLLPNMGSSLNNTQFFKLPIGKMKSELVYITENIISTLSDYLLFESLQLHEKLPRLAITAQFNSFLMCDLFIFKYICNISDMTINTFLVLHSMKLKTKRALTQTKEITLRIKV